MNPIETATSLLALVALSTMLGLLWRARSGHIRRFPRSNPAGDGVISIAGAPTFGSRATLLQFSTEVCTPCRSTHTLLNQLASELGSGLGDVNHIDIDITTRPEIANRFNLLQSPTTFILDGRGVLRARIGGAPRRAEVKAELERILVASQP
jgi:thiol-disulfide isomerase/thioredoxin